MRLGVCRDERGAVVPMVAIILTVLMISAAFAVDLGKQRVVRQDMQALADVVALDMVREIRGRTVAVIEADPAWQTAIDQSVARNSSTLGDDPEVDVVLGDVDPDTRVFTPLTGATEPNGVRVTAGSEIDFAFVPGSGGASRTAIAATEPVACFRMGSFALALSAGNSALLNTLIGDALNLGVLSYDGLADAEVSLLGLAAELGAASADELLALPNVSLGDLVLATAEVLGQEGGSTADVQLLETVAASVGSLPAVAVTDLIAVAPGADSALTAGVNVLDLLATSAFLSNGNSFLTIPDLQASLGLTGTGLTSNLQVIQEPQFGCGPVDVAQASTSQIAIDLGGTLAALPDILGTTVSADMTLDLDVASADGTLKEVSCGTLAPGSPDTMRVDVTDGLLTATLTVTVTLRDLGIPVAGGSIVIGTAPPVAPGQATMTFPTEASYTTRYTTGSGSIGLTGLTANTSGFVLLGVLPVGVTLNELLSAVLSEVVNPLVAALDTSVLTPLTDLLGANVSGADVWGVPRPNCDASALRG
ncbi:hypothetical protein GCM10027270_06050 [Nocardioides ginkgobilobae]